MKKEGKERKECMQCVKYKEKEQGKGTEGRRIAERKGKMSWDTHAHTRTVK